MGDHRRLHDLLSELRHRAGDPSLRKINGLCGVSVGYLSQIFAGKTAPGADVAVRVAQALKATEREQARIRFYAEGTETDRSAQRAPEPHRPRRPGWQGCPYLGLQPFEEQHAAVFYGRRALTGRLLDRLREHPPDAGLLLVLGSSGAGKSSLLRAGLMNALADDDLEPDSRLWPRRVITPTSDPIRQLAISLAELAAADAISVQRTLTAHPEQAYLLAGQAVAATGHPSGPRVVLVVDQLEELFTLSADPAAQETFLTALHSLATHPALPGGRPAALVVAGLRGDFLQQALGFAPVRQAAEAGVFAVGAMSESELREAVAGPAAEAGHRIPDDLCAVILDDLRERGLPTGFDSGALPLLSQVMFVMWQNRESAGLTVEGYHRTGGVAGIVRTSAEQVYDTLGPDGRDLARRVFLHLTTTTDGRITRRPGSRAALRAATGSDDTDAVIEAFAAQRLLTVADSGTVTIAHEELLRSWHRLGDWLRPGLTDQALYRALNDDVQDWRERRRDPSYLYQGARLVAVDDALRRWNDDPARHFPLSPAATEFLDASRRRARRRRRAYQGVGAIMVLLLALTGTAAVIANRNAALALSRQLAAQSATLLPRDSELANLLAVQAYRIRPTDEAVDSIYNVAAQPVVRTLNGHTDVVSAVAFSPDGRRLVSAGYDRTVRVWDLADGESRTLSGHTDTVFTVVFSPDGNRLASGGADGTVRLWDLANGQSRALNGHTGAVSAVAFSPDGRRLVSAGYDRTVRVWDLANGESYALTGHRGEVCTVAFSPDGQHLASGGDDGTVRVWDLGTGRARVFAGHTGRVSAVVYSPDGRQLASSSRDRSLRLWDLGTGRARVFTGHTDRVFTVAFSPDGRQLASSSRDRSLRIWDLDTGEPRTLTGHTDKVSGVAYSPDGNHLASAGGEGAVRLWDLRTGESRILTGHTGKVYTVAFSRDGALASAGEDATVRLWDVATGRSRILTGHTGDVRSVAFSPDGHRLVSAGDDATVRIWDVATGQPRTLAGHTGRVSAVAFGPDGRQVVSAGYDRTVRLWDAGSGESRVLSGHTGEVYAVAFGPDGRHLVSAGHDRTVRVWDAGSGESRVLSGHTGEVYAVAFSPDGHHLASGSGDGTVRVWANAGLTPAEAIDLICRGVGRDLTPAERERYLRSAGPDRRTCP